MTIEIQKKHFNNNLYDKELEDLILGVTLKLAFKFWLNIKNT